MALCDVLDECRPLAMETQALQAWSKMGSHGISEPVTSIDLEIEKAIVDFFARHCPSACVLSEETRPAERSLTSGIVVVVDPVDGTASLLRGEREFAVSVAVLAEGEVILAVVDMPGYDVRISAVRGQGTDANGRRVHLCRAPRTRLDGVRIGVSPSQHRSHCFRAVREALPEVEFVPVSSVTCKTAAVITGSLDAALYLPIPPGRAMVWDYLASAFLLERAGGEFTSLAGQSMVQLHPYVHTEGWIAGTRDLIMSICARLTRHLGNCSDCL